MNRNIFTAKRCVVLLLLIIVVGLCVYYKTPLLSKDESLAAEWLYSNYPPDFPLITSKTKWLREVQLIDIPGKKIDDDEQIEHLKFMPNLTTFQFSNNDKITSRGFQTLASLPRLEHLSIYDSSLEDSELEIISQARSLESLNIVTSELTGVGFSYLGNCKTLKRLYLKEAESLADSDLAFLESLPKLDTLIINGATELTPECLPYIEKSTVGIIEIYGSPSLPFMDVRQFEREILERKHTQKRAFEGE